MYRLEVNVVNDGEKNVTINLSGYLKENLPLQTVVDFGALRRSPKRIRFEGIVFAIEEKAGFHLWWVGEDRKALILPVESRGFFDFEKSGSLHSPEWAHGIGLSSFKIEGDPKGFLLILDMGKQ